MGCDGRDVCPWCECQGERLHRLFPEYSGEFEIKWTLTKGQLIIIQADKKRTTAVGLMALTRVELCLHSTGYREILTEPNFIWVQLIKARGIQLQTVKLTEFSLKDPNNGNMQPQDRGFCCGSLEHANPKTSCLKLTERTKVLQVSN